MATRLLPNQTGDFLSLLRNLPSALPRINLIALVNNPQQQPAAWAAGATHTLLKGFLDSARAS